MKKGKKLNAKQLGDLVFSATVDYTQAYYKHFKVTTIDKTLWGALHLGIITGMRACGYTEKEMVKGVEAGMIKINDTFKAV